MRRPGTRVHPGGGAEVINQPKRIQTGWIFRKYTRTDGANKTNKAGKCLFEINSGHNSGSLFRSLPEIKN